MDGSLANFQLGISADGTNCMMVFVDDEQRMTTCSVNFLEFNQFIASLSQAAGEMARRRTDSHEDEPASALALNVSSAAFKLCTHDGYLLGALASNAGEVVGIRMCPDVANQMTRAMLLTLPAMSAS
jgi:putative hemolysin